MGRSKLIVFLALLLCSFHANASHIVGGEFEILHVVDNRYRINLILYFDEINGNPGAEDLSVSARIFRKSDDQVMRTVVLPQISRTNVEYTQPECALPGVLVTSKLLYTTEVVLDPNEYDDPLGYYIAWERCCRNYNITNIFSDNPNTGGIYAGQTFYLEFPPLIKNGERFINSSPQLFPPLSDYACPNRFYYVDFGGTDADGDSLVYSLDAPFNTKSADAIPPNGVRPAPYPAVTFKPGFDARELIPGNPSLAISTGGLLTITPTISGLHVFAVRVEEFRDGEKIGELRRDFQMLVLEGCEAPGNKPNVEVELPDKTRYNEQDTIVFQAPDKKCVDFKITDPDGGENVRLKVVPVNFSENNAILPPSTSGTLNGTQDTLTLEVCFQDCPPLATVPFQVDLIALDDACPLPLQDTVRLTILIEPPPNDPPLWQQGDEVSITVNEIAGGFTSIPLRATDGDGEFLVLDVFADDFDTADRGISIDTVLNQAGELELAFNWDYDCQKYNFDGFEEFQVKLVVDDADRCDVLQPDTLVMDLKINLPPNTAPEIQTSLGNNDYYRLEFFTDEVANFDISSLDQDNDPLTQWAVPANFNGTQFNFPFDTVQGPGAAGVSQNFNWELDCGTFAFQEQDSFRVYFLSEDFDRCQITNRDTLTIDFIITPRPNQAPVLSANGALEIIDDVRPGFPVEYELLGRDLDNDRLFLRFLRAENVINSLGLEYAPGNSIVQGTGEVTSLLKWTPSCDLLGPDFSPAEYSFTFILEDGACPETASDTLIFQVTVKDIEQEPLDELPNVFTPNPEDDVNAIFQLDNFLPEDDCKGNFEFIQIYNRWGRLVYESNDRSFTWDGSGNPAGVYFYHIRYTHLEYKGTVSVLY